MLVILAVFSGLVAKVAVPTLGAILIFAAIGSLRPAEVATIWHTGLTSQIPVLATFAPPRCSCRSPRRWGIGVALSLLQLNTEAMDLAVVELVPREGG